MHPVVLIIWLVFSGDFKAAMSSEQIVVWDMETCQKMADSIRSASHPISPYTTKSSRFEMSEAWCLDDRTGEIYVGER